LTNAIKFTERGRVKLTLRRELHAGFDMLRFEIADTGIGIAAADQHLLFENFSQIDRSDARRHGGTGLGLAISKRLAQAMGGAIGVVSSAGAGSVFWFTALLPPAASPSSVPALKPVHIRAARILVVDDNRLNQIVAEAILAQDGHEVVLAANGAQAVSAVQAGAFDLVLMDMRMPVMDGMEATRRIRALAAPACDVPIVALSANVMAEQITRCREAGMNDHLAKPVDRDSLRRMVAAWTSAAKNNGPPPAPATEADEFDRQTAMLGELFNGDREAIIELLNGAIVSIKFDAGRIARAAEAHDTETLVDAAHRLGGTSGNLRASRLIEIGASVENSAREDRCIVAVSLLPELATVIDLLSARIEAYANGEVARRSDCEEPLAG
jgi:CheY-like chemotaxis protein/HPt (histidine-containing phosphotransfer) domain-containing protein